MLEKVEKCARKTQTFVHISYQRSCKFLKMRRESINKFNHRGGSSVRRTFPSRSEKFSNDHRPSITTNKQVRLTKQTFEQSYSKSVRWETDWKRLLSHLELVTNGLQTKGDETRVCLCLDIEAVEPIYRFESSTDQKTKHRDRFEESVMEC